MGCRWLIWCKSCCRFCCFWLWGLFLKDICCRLCRMYWLYWKLWVWGLVMSVCCYVVRNWSWFFLLGYVFLWYLLSCCCVFYRISCNCFYCLLYLLKKLVCYFLIWGEVGIFWIVYYLDWIYGGGSMIVGVFENFFYLWLIFGCCLYFLIFGEIVCSIYMYFM